MPKNNGNNEKDKDNNNNGKKPGIVTNPGNSHADTV